MRRLGGGEKCNCEWMGAFTQNRCKTMPICLWTVCLNSPATKLIVLHTNSDCFCSSHQAANATLPACHWPTPNIQNHDPAKQKKMQEKGCFCVRNVTTMQHTFTDQHHQQNHSLLCKITSSAASRLHTLFLLFIHGHRAIDRTNSVLFVCVSIRLSIYGITARKSIVASHIWVHEKNSTHTVVYPNRPILF